MRGWWSAQSFRTQLLVLAGAGLALRVAYILIWKRDTVVWGDAYAYHWSARLLADGHGFIQPLPFTVGEILHSADRPPAYILYLAFFSLFGIESFLSHMLVSALMGAGTIVLAGLLGREVGGPRVGLVAAGLAAVYPNFWLHDGMVMSETMTIFTVTAALLVAYRFIRVPTYWRGAVFGAVCGVAALTHPDSALFVPLIGLPMVLLLRGVDWRRKLAHLTVIGVASLAVVTPWIVRNLVQFEERVLLSTGLDVTLAVSNCDETYHGTFKGFWYMPCILQYGTPPGDLSERAVVWREGALDHIKANRDELPSVLAARVGRTWGVYRPLQQIEFDNRLEGHELGVTWAAYVTYVLLTPATVAGLVLLRRRRVPIYPLLAGPVTVTIATLLTFGNTRYRASAEPTWVVAGAVALVALAGWVQVRRRRASGDDDVADLHQPTLVQVGS